ncbi:NAD(P)H-dependent flavin oxidoreductase [Cryptosporangium arvum]|uniref:2-nitropropane dioxygenase-like enzyme n=1 Tax=Cryptosporangium arvum DSM 44712 TaxID=927661 RepID=A0A010Z4Y9_9ACTN|nr:nitronate monooxygenase [Cryptosporangium arvum]EXG82413.1 2-nitropropane dioxygenase-like enzyme [Cryptosporangium arvum DSM 44712]
MTATRFSTPLTELTGVEHPIVQTGMGWVAGPRLVSATAEAGALGLLASATMSIDQLEKAILEVQERTDRPFGVNLRADASDAGARVDLLIRYGVKVASFALAPKPELIARLKEHDVVVMPSVGAAKHARKVASWGADLVLVQGGEGGGHTGPVPTTLLLPSVLDAVDIPVIAAGGFFDGRGLAAALSYGAAGIGMGTRFLLTSDSAVPDAIKQKYLEFGLTGTVVTTKADGMPHRLLRTPFIEALESGNRVRRAASTVRRALAYKRMSGASWRSLVSDGWSMTRGSDRSWTQTMQAANTPMLLKAGLVDGDTSAGMLASGQAVGVIDDLPSCEELVARIVADAVTHLTAAHAALVPPTPAGAEPGAEPGPPPKR